MRTIAGFAGLHMNGKRGTPPFHFLRFGLGRHSRPGRTHHYCIRWDVASPHLGAETASRHPRNRAVLGTTGGTRQDDTPT